VPTIKFDYQTGIGMRNYKKSHKVKVSYDDKSGSGISSAKYCWAVSTGTCTPNTSVSDGEILTRPGNKDVVEIYKLKVEVIDKMGHKTTRISNDLYFDNTMNLYLLK